MTSSNPIGILAQRLAAGERLRAAWSSLTDAGLAEIMVRQGFDTAVLDMQHGAHTYASALQAISAVALAGAPAMVRIPVGDFAMASRVCDAGAAGVIAPMINSAAEAAAFAAFVKYPPIGARSWGPHRSVVLSGLEPRDYLAHANAMHLAIPMVETQAALDALDDILAVPGVDGVFVGPSDLSIALTGGTVDPFAPAVDRALAHVAARAKAAGKIAAMFCFDGRQAKAMGERGFGLCSIASDGMLLAAAARAEVLATR